MDEIVVEELVFFCIVHDRKIASLRTGVHGVVRSESVDCEVAVEVLSVGILVQSTRVHRKLKRYRNDTKRVYSKYSEAHWKEYILRLLSQMACIR